MDQVEQPIRLPARCFLSLNFLIMGVFWLLTAFVVFMLLSVVSWYTLAPWDELCCPAWYPPGGSWERVSNDFFEDHAWLAYLPVLLLAGYCLVRFLQLVVVAARPIRAALFFSLVNIATFLLGWSLYAASTYLFSHLDGIIDWLAVSYGGVSHAYILSGHLALWSVLLLLAVLYSAYPRRLWLAWDRFLARGDAEVDEMDEMDEMDDAADAEEPVMPPMPPIPRFLHPNFLITCFLLLLVSVCLFPMLWIAASFALWPWTQLGWAASWPHELTDAFEVVGWVAVALTMLALIAIGLVQFVRRVAAASQPERVAVVFLLIHALAILAVCVLFLTSAFVLSQLGGTFNLSTTSDGVLTYGMIISCNLALWPVLAALMWLYSGRPRSFWSNMVDY